MRFKRREIPQPRLLLAKREGHCAETGDPIAVGDEVLWCPATGKTYFAQSQVAQQLCAQAFARTWNMADAQH